MTDEEKVKSLGFVKSPTCPLDIVYPAESREWLTQEMQRRQRYRNPDRLGYIDWVAGQWEEFDRRSPDLDILNQCLVELIREKFKEHFGQLPKCDLKSFLFSARQSRGMTWRTDIMEPQVESWGDYEGIRKSSARARTLAQASALLRNHT